MRDEYLIMAIAWPIVLGWIGLVIALNYKQHPRALFMLFMVELWERFSYYGMRALLILYLTKELVTGAFGMPKAAAYGIYAAYGALVYLTPLIGGILADKYLGFRNSIIWGACLMAAGQFTLAASSGNQTLLFIGLSLLTIGNGFFKPNISSLIGKFYPQGDPRRDGAFTIFYMGINMGAFLAPLTCGAVGEIEGWSFGFLLAGIGMVIGLILFLITTAGGFLEKHADPPPAPEGGRKDLYIYLGTFFLVPIASGLMILNDVMDFLLGGIGVGMIGYMLYLSFEYDTVERERIWVITILLLFTTIFWTFFELAGSALSLFTDENVTKTILGQELKTSMFQAVNPLCIMIFAPIFAIMWTKLAQSGKEPSAPVKFAVGLLLLGAGFLIMNLGAAAATAGMVPALFLLLLYLLHTLGELALSPVGLSLVTKLAPERIVGFMMGFWFLSSAIAHQAGKLIAGETVAPKDATKEQTLAINLEVFNNVGAFAIGSGVLLLLMSRTITRWMHLTPSPGPESAEAKA